MLKVTYTHTGHYLEYCPDPLDLMLGDRLCTYARAQRSFSVQPMSANIPLLIWTVDTTALERFPQVEAISRCDRYWLEVTIAGLWIAEVHDQDNGIFVTELDPRLEQRLWRLWQLTQPSVAVDAIAY
jgi:hypothetical protein